MLIAELTKKMIEYSNGNLHDIAHFIKVYGYAKTIGACEKLDQETQETGKIFRICWKKYFVPRLAVHC